jgi:virulence-associated protein VagC
VGEVRNLYLNADDAARGGSRAVRLPKSCRFPDDQREVVVRRVGRQIILEPADEWTEAFVATLGSWQEEIEQPASNRSRRRNPFE